LPKVEHPKFEGHVAPNEDEYQKYVHLKIRHVIVLEYRNLPLNLLIAYWWRR